MLTKLKKRQGGFTLIELLIVVAIIGIIAAILIPNLIDALQKAKQKRTVADIRNTGTSLMSWLTDQVSAAAAGAGATTFSWDPQGVKTYAGVNSLLKPSADFFYMQSVPQVDGWRNPYEFFVNTGSLLAPTGVIGIRSTGRDNSFSSATYTTGPFTATDYDEDIAWADGYFVRWPGQVN